VVEELARWKSSLSNRIGDLQETLKVLLEERIKTRNYSLNAYHNLIRLNDNSKLVKSVNIIDLALINQELTENLLDLYGKISELNVNAVMVNTPGENLALKLLKSPVGLGAKPDKISDALVGAAIALSSGMAGSGTSRCCKHCKGEILDL